MKRKLILTPFDHGSFFAIHQFLNEKLRSEEDEIVDIQHILFSSVIMCGVDEIHSFGKPMNTASTLVTKNLSEKSMTQYFDCINKVDLVFKNYNHEKPDGVTYFKYVIGALLFCMKNNSIPLFSDNLEDQLKKAQLPSELSVPIQLLIASIDYKTANLPVIRGDINKQNIKKLLDVYQSKDFLNYKESQAEIENTTILTTSTIKKIEKAGRDLTKNNSGLLFLKNNVINVLPVTAKLIDLFFGKLPGIISSYASDIAVGYLKDYKSIPIYNCGPLLTNEIEKRLQQYIQRKVEKTSRME